MMTTTADIAVIIAVKRLSTAKTRLATAFSAHTRKRIVLAMLTDTIAAVHGVNTIRGVNTIGPIIVVTADPDAAQTARDGGASVIPDLTAPTHPDPLNNAINTAWVAIAEFTTNSVVLQGDLPALRSTELDQALAQAHTHRRSFVADRHASGTTALFTFNTAPHPLFGADSARRHRHCGAVELTTPWPGLRCDIDTPEDLSAAKQLGLGPATAGVISGTQR